MSNPANNGVLIGRLASDPKVFENADKSRRLLATVAVDDNFKNRAGERPTQFIQVEAFLPAGQTLGWNRTGKGDLVALNYRVDTTSYTDANGEVHYPVRLVVEGTPTYLEPKSVTDARKNSTAAVAAPAPAGASA